MKGILNMRRQVPVTGVCVAGGKKVKALLLSCCQLQFNLARPMSDRSCGVECLFNKTAPLMTSLKKTKQTRLYLRDVISLSGSCQVSSNGPVLPLLNRREDCEIC